MSELTNINEQEVQGKIVKFKNTNFIVREQFQTSADAPTFKELFEKYFDELYTKQ